MSVANNLLLTRLCSLQMLSLLEHMYHELGLVKEFNMNKITLKRWLVSDMLISYVPSPIACIISCFTHGGRIYLRAQSRANWTKQK